MTQRTSFQPYHLLDPVVKVVVLAAPAVEGVCVAVHLDEVAPRDGGHPTEVVVVLLSIKLTFLRP